MVAKAEPLFDLGQVIATRGALEALEQAGQSPSEFLRQHVVGNWGGELCDEDKTLNDEAVKDGSRILSAYRLKSGVKVWVITESVGDDGQRSTTTLLLPQEY